MSAKPNPLAPFRRKDNRSQPRVKAPRERAFVKPAPSKASQLALDVAAFDAMCARRPLVPPPLPYTAHTRTAGALALAEDKRLGLVGELRGAHIASISSISPVPELGAVRTVRKAKT